MQEKFSLRPAIEDDLAKIVEIEGKVHVAPWTLNNFKAELEKPYSHVLVMTDDETDEIIGGYIVFWVMDDGAHILNIAVDLPFRGRGFAKEMIRKVVDMALGRGRKRVLLEVRKSNNAAIQLYQGLNFTIVHVKKGAYSNGEDAYDMALELEDSLAELRF